MTNARETYISIGVMWFPLLIIPVLCILFAPAAEMKRLFLPSALNISTYLVLYFSKHSQLIAVACGLEPTGLTLHKVECYSVQY
jgi:hypothetical protein